jgi:hypothetical protein
MKCRWNAIASWNMWSSPASLSSLVASRKLGGQQTMRQMASQGGNDLENRAEEIDQIRQRLRKTSDWDSLWKDGLTPWDLGKSTPALTAELASSSPSSWETSTKTMRTLVPGCGAGYDLVTLERHHNDLIAAGHIKHASIIGLDISETSLGRAAGEFETACEFSPFERPTRVDLVKGDFFDSSAWKTVHSVGGDEETRATICPPENQTFDFIFDYTFFCALPPELREAWGKRIAELLTPETGRLLTFMFPLIPVPDGKELKGPPFPVVVSDYQQVLEPHGVLMEPEPYQSPDSVPGRAEMELVCWWKHTKLETTAKL